MLYDIASAIFELLSTRKEYKEKKYTYGPFLGDKKCRYTSGIDFASQLNARYRLNGAIITYRRFLAAKEGKKWKGWEKDKINLKLLFSKYQYTEKYVRLIYQTNKTNGLKDVKNGTNTR